MAVNSVPSNVNDVVCNFHYNTNIFDVALKYVQIIFLLNSAKQQAKTSNTQSQNKIHLITKCHVNKIY